MSDWKREAGQWMTVAQRSLKNGCLSTAASALREAAKLIPPNALTKQSETAWTRFSKLNEKLNKAYEA